MIIGLVMRMSDENPWQDSTMKEWVDHVLNDMVPKMEGSAAVMQLIPDPNKHGPGDVKFWVELGCSIMLDKPIIGVIMGDYEIPPKLADVADRIVRLPHGVTPEGSLELKKALDELVGEDDIDVEQT